MPKDTTNSKFTCSKRRENDGRPATSELITGRLVQPNAEGRSLL
jgi:hypothetical protein